MTDNIAAAKQLFADWQETMITSCLQQLMGEVFVGYGEHPVSAMAVIGDFCFLVGVPDSKLLLQNIGLMDSRQFMRSAGSHRPDNNCRNFMIMVPQHEGWSQVIESLYGEAAKRITRYAIKKEPDVFDRETLKRAAAALPSGYTIQLIDEPLFHLCREQEWSRDFVSNYRDYEAYQKLGLGVAALKNGIPVAGASSYAVCSSGIEIEIDTREDYRRRGLAYACGARLILECLERGWYPSWDAQNLASVALAEKLGYHFDHEYPAYEIYGNEGNKQHR